MGGKLDIDGCGIEFLYIWYTDVQELGVRALGQTSFLTSRSRISRISGALLLGDASKCYIQYNAKRNKIEFDNGIEHC
jgi:hypothetical protein